MPGQGQERSLEDILRRLLALESITARAPDHRAMAGQQRFKGQLIIGVGESLQEVPVRVARESPGMKKDADVLRERPRSVGRHGRCRYSAGKSDFLYVT